MRAINRIVTLCFGAALIAAGFGAMSASAQSVEGQTPPPPPEWIDRDGRINLDNAPREFFVAGPEGEILTDTRGTEIRVPSHLDTLPPPPIRPNYDEVVLQPREGANGGSVAEGDAPALRMFLRRAADEQVRARGNWMELDEVDGFEVCYGVIGGVAFAESPCGQ